MSISENDLDTSKYDIDETAGTLQIFDTKYVDSGTYECTVSNLAGVTVKQIVLIVNGESLGDDWTMRLVNCLVCHGENVEGLGLGVWVRVRVGVKGWG